VVKIKVWQPKQHLFLYWSIKDCVDDKTSTNSQQENTRLCTKGIPGPLVTANGKVIQITVRQEEDIIKILSNSFIPKKGVFRALLAMSVKPKRGKFPWEMAWTDLIFILSEYNSSVFYQSSKS